MTENNSSQSGKKSRIWLVSTMALGLFILSLLPAVQGRPSGMTDESVSVTTPTEQFPDPVDPKAPLTEKQKQVLKALEKGVEHLRATQTPQGNWHAGGKQHPVGYAAMPALALLECGIPANDPAVQKAIQFVRSAAPKLEETYEIALAILLLNRLGDANDVPMIRTLAYRLIAGQLGGGGWSYRCPILDQGDEKMLLTYLKQNEPKFVNTTATVVHPSLRILPRGLESLIDPVIRKERDPVVLAEPIKKPDPDAKITLPDLIPKDPKYDPKKSDSQSEYDPNKKPATPPKSEPAPPPLQDAPKETGQGPNDTPKKDIPKKDTPKGAGFPVQKKETPQSTTIQATVVPIQTWPSVPAYVKQMMIGARANGWAMGLQIEDNSNTQFAILGLWAARKHDVPVALTLVRLDQRFRSSQFADGSWAYHLPGAMAGDPKKGFKQPKAPTPSMTCVGLMGLGVAHGAFQDAAIAAKKNPAPANYLFDPAIQRGLFALSKGVDPKINFAGHKVNLYFFWSLERTMVMFHLPTLGNVDWHAWGTDVLLPRQTPRGSWSEGGYPGASEPIDTSMAMLFLSRANLNRDLSESLRRYLVVLDPARAKAPENK